MAPGSQRQRAGHRLTSLWPKEIGCAAIVLRHSENSGLNMPDDQRHIRLSLEFLMYPEGGFWFGHCLELDIVAEGTSPREAAANCIELCGAQISYAMENGNIESIFRQAPPSFWRMFSVAEDYHLEHALPEPIERAEARELQLA